MEFTTKVKTDLYGALQDTQILSGIMMTGDYAANKFVVDLYYDAEPVELPQDTKIVGYFTRSDGETIETDGSINDDGDPFVIMPKEAYDVPGIITIVIRMFDDPIMSEQNVITDWNKKIVIATMTCDIKSTTEDPNKVIIV